MDKYLKREAGKMGELERFDAGSRREHISIEVPLDDVRMEVLSVIRKG